MRYVILLFLGISISVSAINTTDLIFKKVLLEEELHRKLEENKIFKKELAFRESSNRPDVINSIGAMGMYQFMPYTLKDLGLGHITVQKFREDPSIFPETLQEDALELKIQKDLQQLQYQRFRKNGSINYLNKADSIIQSVDVSVAGLIAGCHLGGVQGVINFLDSNGTRNPSDVYGTSIFKYIREFSAYKYHFIEPLKLKSEIQCLQDSLDLLNPCLLRKSKLYIFQKVLIKSNVTEIALIYHFKKTFTQANPKLFTYLLEYKSNYQNIIEVYYSLEAQRQKDMPCPTQERGEKWSGIMQVNGMDKLKYQKELRSYQKEVDFSNFTLSRYGMLLGTLNYLTYFQSLN